MVIKLFVIAFTFSLGATHVLAAEKACGYVNRFYLTDDGQPVVGVRGGEATDGIPTADPREWMFEMGLSKNALKNQNDEKLALAAINSKFVLCRCVVEGRVNRHNGTEYNYFLAESLWEVDQMQGPCDKPIVIHDLMPTKKGDQK